MNMKLMLLLSAVTGLVITLITGLVDVTPMPLVGSTWHGWPLPWFYVIIYPGSPISVNWLNLIGDIIVWFVVALTVALVISKFKRPSKT
jgi:large-conductance mechanosensitive channel